MPIINIGENNPLVDGRQSETALMIQRGMVRFLEERGFAVLTEFPLASGRRADILALDKKGRFSLIEIKSSIEDFKVDSKWPEYVDFCDHFAFATAASVPADIFPTNEALYIADQFGAECIREADEGKLSPATRKALTLRFARIAAKRAEKIIQFASNSTLGLPTILDTD